MVLNTLSLNVEKDQAWDQTLEPRAVQEKTCNEVVCLSLLIRSTSLSCVAVHFPILSGDVLFFALSFSPFWHWWLTFWRWDLTKIVGSWFLNPGHSESKLMCSSTKHALGVLGGGVTATCQPLPLSITATWVLTRPPAWSGHCTHAWLLGEVCFWKRAMGQMPHFKWPQAAVRGVETRGSIQSLFSLHASLFWSTFCCSFSSFPLPTNNRH